MDQVRIFDPVVCCQLGHSGAVLRGDTGKGVAALYGVCTRRLGRRFRWLVRRPAGRTAQFPGDHVKVRGNETADIPPVHFHGALAHFAAVHVSLCDHKGAAAHLGDNANVIRCAGVVGGGVVCPVLPVVHAGVAHLGGVCVVLRPDPFFLGDLDVLSHAALRPGVLRDPCLDVRRGGRGGTMGVTHLYAVTSCQWLVVVVDVQDLQVLGAASGCSVPCVDNVRHLSAQFVSGHVYTSSQARVRWFAGARGRFLRGRLGAAPARSDGLRRLVLVGLDPAHDAVFQAAHAEHAAGQRGRL